ncbi:MAG: hypothetical protein HKP58_18650 [Desulfatitalea sp.]|nr:hypothetical protein [Desulfatitalea sp.]NNK02436.1 hypothetical protein [Desulfatitalea sp.]
MKSVFVLFCMLMNCVGCAYVRNPYPHLIETQTVLVSDCRLLGLISETADAGHIVTPMARREMVNRVKFRADQLDATHIVWLHKTDTAAAAEVYDCGE